MAVNRVGLEANRGVGFKPQDRGEQTARPGFLAGNGDRIHKHRPGNSRKAHNLVPVMR